MKILQHAFHGANRILADPHFALAVRLFAVAAVVFLPAVAFAYPGETFVLWLRGSVVAPLCFFGILGSVIFVCFRPQHAVFVLAATIAALFVMYLMTNGSQVTHQLEAAGQG